MKKHRGDRVRVRLTNKIGYGGWLKATVAAKPDPGLNYCWVLVRGEATIRPVFLWDLV